MSPAFAKKFFLYGLAIAALEEFITQGVLKERVLRAVLSQLQIWRVEATT